MESLFNSKSGFGLIGILFVIVIIAAIYLGSDFIFSEKSETKNTVEQYNEAKIDLNNINEINNKRVNDLKEELNATSTLK